MKIFSFSLLALLVCLQSMKHTWSLSKCAIFRRRTLMSLKAFRLFSTSGHESGGVPNMTTEQENILSNLKAYQETVARPSMAEEVRTLIENSIMYGTISTNSDQYPGYPTGSVVGFELDDSGLPFFVFSTMSAHTRDINKDSRCSLTVLANDFKGAAQGRVVLIGDVKKLNDQVKQVALREKYLKRHKDAYWIDFGDFSYYTMTSLTTVRYVGGFAMAGSITTEQYQSAKPDPVAAFSAPVISHMNVDHSDSIVAMVKHYMKVPCHSAQIISMDKLGMTLKASIFSEAESSKVRLAYPREVTERKAIKEVLVEMTKAATTAEQ